VTPRRNKTPITQTGSFEDDAGIARPCGWAFDTCRHRCPCHISPATGGLEILQHDASGSLGLKRFGLCTRNCCEPWSYTELLSFLRDLTQIEELASTEEEPA
jgi:hypothetical protein